MISLLKNWNFNSFRFRRIRGDAFTNKEWWSSIWSLVNSLFYFFSLRFDSRSFDLARIIRDNETLFRKRYPMFTNIRNMWIKKYHTMSRWRNAYVIGNHQVTLYHFVSLRFTFTEFKTFSILRFRSCFLRATWSVSCTLLLMMKNYNNLFQQTTITHKKKTSIARIYIKNVSRF